MEAIRKRKAWPYGKDNRVNIAQNILESINIDSMETITVAYKIKDMIDKTKEIIFCIAYVEVDIDGAKYKSFFTDKRPDFLGASSDLFFKGIFPAGSSISKDGEFRSGFVNWDVIRIALEKNPKLKDLNGDLYEYIIKNMKDRKYFLTIEHFYPTDKIKQEHQFELESITLDSKIRFFCISWFTFYFNFNYSVIPGHLNEIFLNLMLKYQAQDHEFFKSLCFKYGYDSLFELLWIFSNYQKPYSSIDTSQKYKLGQKIIPMNLLEAQNPFNISYAIWREYFISKRASDLVINELTPGFPIFAGWMFIKTGDRYVYDNPDHILRLERSKVAEKITEILIQAQTYTYMHIDVPADRGDKADKTSWLSAEFKKLYYMIRDSITHSKDNIIMSNISLNIINEYMGRTLYNSAELSKKSKHFQKYMTNIIAEAHFETFSRYLFEICYNLYLLNTKLGVIHGDLHLNNILLTLNVYIHSTKFSTEDRKIVYSIGDKNYMFPLNFYYACIIDFSRSLVKYNEVQQLRDPTVPIIFPFTSNQEEFRRSQISDLVSYLLKEKPVYAERKHQIRDFINDNYDSCFKLLTLLDLYSFLQKLNEFLETRPPKEVSSRIMQLVTSMYSFVDNYLSSKLQELLEIGTGSYDKEPYPILIVIEEMFKFKEATDDDITKEDGNICDFYDANTPLKYDMVKNLPPKFKISKQSAERVKAMQKKNEDNFKIINIIMHRQRSKHP